MKYLFLSVLLVSLQGFSQNELADKAAEQKAKVEAQKAEMNAKKEGREAEAKAKLDARKAEREAKKAEQKAKQEARDAERKAKQEARKQEQEAKQAKRKACKEKTNALMAQRDAELQLADDRFRAAVTAKDKAARKQALDDKKETRKKYEGLRKEIQECQK